jgi:hypothetical protein
MIKATVQEVIEQELTWLGRNIISRVHEERDTFTRLASDCGFRTENNSCAKVFRESRISITCTRIACPIVSLPEGYK